ncbi:MAG: S8 family serine peptidase [Planctomycetota bacterium]
MLTTLLTLALLAGPGDAEAKIHPDLRAVWSEDVPYRVYAVLDGRLTLEQLRDEGLLRLERGERRRYVAERLRAFAAERQAGARALLAELEGEGEVRRVEVLWVANAIVFHGTPDALRRVAALPEVERIGWSPVRSAAEIEDRTAPSPAPAAGGPSSNLQDVQAPAAWSLGYRGDGVLILNIDSGVQRTHTALAPAIWSNPGEVVDGIDNDGNGYVDDTWGWDFLDGDDEPLPGSTPLGTPADHGTWTAGVMVGDGAPLDPTTGVAPEATMAVARIGSEAGHWLALQYGIAIGADATGSSNSFKWYWTPIPDYPMHRHVQDMILAAGMIHANSVGNQGGSPQAPVPFQVSAPGNSPSAWRHPIQGQVNGGVSGVVGVGGSGFFGAGSHGPSAWEDIQLYDPAYPHAQDSAQWDYPYGGFGGTQQGLMKPDVEAPFSAQTTSVSGGFTSFSGTSASSPHVSGSFALLFDAQPAAEPRHLSQALQITALDLGQPGKDTTTGAGRIQVKDALLRLLTLTKVDDLTPGLGDVLTVSTYGAPGNLYAVLFGVLTGSFETPAFTLDLVPPFGIFELGQFDASGVTHTPVVLPQMPTLVGVDVHLQAAADDTAGATGQILVSVLETFRVE